MSFKKNKTKKRLSKLTVFRIYISKNYSFMNFEVTTFPSINALTT